MRGAARKTQWRACEFLRGSRIACRVACQIYLFCKRPPRCNFQLDGMLVNRHWHRQQSWQKGCDAGWRSSPSSKQRQPEGEGGVDYVGIRGCATPVGNPVGGDAVPHWLLQAGWWLAALPGKPGTPSMVAPLFAWVSPRPSRP